MTLIPPPRNRVAAFLNLWLPPVAWVAIIFTLSTDIGSQQQTHSLLFRALAVVWPGIERLPWVTQMGIEWTIRKGAHLTIYAGLAFLLLRALANGGSPSRKTEMRALVIVAICAAADEYHQSFVSTRTATRIDVVIDCVGALLGTALYGGWLHRRERSGKRFR